jgi:hypothetical protein
MDDKLSLRIDLRAFNGHQEVQTIVARIGPEELYALVTLAEALVKRVGVLPGENAFEVWKAAITAKCHALQATGQRIKEKRFHLGWSRRQLAGELKLSQSTIVSCERGRARSAFLHQVESFLDGKPTKPRR